MWFIEAECYDVLECCLFLGNEKELKQLLDTLSDQGYNTAKAYEL
jgi:hypothetical protein